jgi:hypothetical protein
VFDEIRSQVKTFIYKSTIDGHLVEISAPSLCLATPAARFMFGNDAFTWEGIK